MKPRSTFSTVMGTAIAVLVLGVGVTALNTSTAGTVEMVAMVLILILGGAAAIISMVYVRRARLKRIAHREPLSAEQIFSRFYEENGLRKEVVLSIWREISNTLALPTEKLRPTDKFNEELEPLAGWHFYNDHLQDLLTWADTYARNRGAKIDPAEFKTLDDLVRRLSVL